MNLGQIQKQIEFGVWWQSTARGFISTKALILCAQLLLLMECSLTPSLTDGFGLGSFFVNMLHPPAAPGLASLPRLGEPSDPAMTGIRLRPGEGRLILEGLADGIFERCFPTEGREGDCVVGSAPFPAGGFFLLAFCIGVGR